MHRSPAGRRAVAAAVVIASALALALAPAALAHARVSPPVAVAKQGQVFALAVPTERENAFTTGVELTLPQGFSIDSFVPSPGWKRQVQQTGSGEEAVIQKVTWSGGRVPTGEDAYFQFLGNAAKAASYTFGIRQTYSDGTVVDWSGPESSDTPASVVEAKSSLGGGGSSILAIVAVALGALALIVATASLLGSGGRRAAA